MLNSRLIATKFDFGDGKFLFASRQRKRRLNAFVTCPETETFACQRFADGASSLERVVDASNSGRMKGSDIVAQVTTAAFPFELSYNGLHDQEGTELDIVVKGTWKISNNRTFLKEYGLDRLKAASSIDVVSFETFAAMRCRRFLIDEIQTLNYDAMSSQDALPFDWWKTKLSQWIDLKWLSSIDVLEVGYESATADLAQVMERRSELLSLEDAEIDDQLKRDLARKHEQAEHDEVLRNLEMAQELSDHERKRKVENQIWEHDQKLLQRERDSEMAKLAHESQKAELLANFEDARDRQEAAQEIRHHAEKAKQQTEQKLQVIESAQIEQCEAAKLTKEAAREGLEIVERLKTAVTGISTSTMSLLEKPKGPAYLAQVFREKSDSSPASVMLKKVEIRTRDIGTRRVDTLAINSPLCFEFMTNRSGYATVLNIGTSGKVYLQVPNSYIGIEQGQVKAGLHYQVPGPELLPADMLLRNGLEYLEIGPPGWEELIVVVSADPLVTDADLFRSSDDNPFGVFVAERIERLLDKLTEMPNEDWDVGVLAFLVE